MNSDVRNQISPDHTMYNYWLQKLIHLSNREINSGSFALGKKKEANNLTVEKCSHRLPMTRCEGRFQGQ